MPPPNKNSTVQLSWTSLRARSRSGLKHYPEWLGTGLYKQTGKKVWRRGEAFLISCEQGRKSSLTKA